MFRFAVRLICGLIACGISALVVMMVVSNRSDTVLSLTPLPYELTLPVYLVIALGFVLGLLVGLVLYLKLSFRTALERRRFRRQLAASAKSSDT